MKKKNLVGLILTIAPLVVVFGLILTAPSENVGREQIYHARLADPKQYTDGIFVDTFPIKKGESLSVEDMLTDEILTIDQEEDLATAASLMVKNKINGIPVVDNHGNLVGVISKTDVVRAFTVVGPHEQLKSK